MQGAHLAGFGVALARMRHGTLPLRQFARRCAARTAA
jgi:hypothetical protein